jgi:hypothetical protein
VTDEQALQLLLALIKMPVLNAGLSGHRGMVFLKCATPLIDWVREHRLLTPSC